MRAAFTFLAGFAVLWAAPAARADDDVQKILDKAIKAHGGADKLAKEKAMEWKTKGTFQVGGQKLEYECKYYFQHPNQLRFDMTAVIQGEKTELSVRTDGKSAWEAAMGMVMEMEGKKLEAFRHNIYTIHISHLIPLKEKAYTLTSAGEIKVDNKAAVGIKVAHKDHPDVTLFFDKDSGLLVKSETKVYNELAGKEVKQEVYFKDYQDKKGAKVFQKMVIKQDGEDFIEEEITEQKAMEKLDAKTFAKP